MRQKRITPDQPLPTFGGNSHEVPHDEVCSLAASLFSTGIYRKIGDTQEDRSDRRNIGSNQEFWSCAPTLFEGAKVLLRSFTVLEWIPSAPGKYFDARAERYRTEALSYYSEAEGEFYILGKLQMILGGVGSIRLSAKQTPSGPLHFLGASSNGISHEGVPIAVTPQMYARVAPMIRGAGGVVCDLIGTIEVLPTIVDQLAFYAGIPKYVVRVTDLENVSQCPPASASVSLNILFPTRFYTDRDSMGWSYVCFDPISHDPDDSLASATQWLSDYARRYSANKQPKIFCDFDEHMEHFELQTDFKIADIANGKLDVALLQEYRRNQNVTINFGHIGDVFRDISGSQIINRSQLS